MKVSLEVTTGPHEGTRFWFTEPDNFIVGRSPVAHFRLPEKDKTLSRLHFMVEVSPPRCRLLDMASRNGTFVNDERVQIADLANGDVIRCGVTQMRVAIDPLDGETLGPPNQALAETVGPPINDPFRNFEIQKELGHGGMGVVYLARRKSDNQLVAMKTVKPSLIGAKGCLERFLREARILRELEHPNIVGFKEIGYGDGTIFLAMEYVAGTDSARLVKRYDARLPIPLCVDIICQVLDGLVFAHEKGVVHRDIKPHNVLVERVGERVVAKTADFGLARILQTSGVSGLTLTGQVCGTFGFIAPEQITNFKQSPPSVDQYAAGATAYFMLTGARSHDFPDDLAKAYSMLLQRPAVPANQRRPDIPIGLSKILDKTLANSPSDRFGSVAELREALTPYRPQVS